MNSEFCKELEKLINFHNMESGSDTPDFILARYLMNCLEVFNSSISERERWYGRVDKPCEDGPKEHP
jgi:hypothetical protein